MAYRQSGTCWHCGQALADIDYAREARCTGCGRASHCCRNCRFFKVGAGSGCAEPVADHVGDKERANFCGYFEAASNATSDGGQSEDALRDAAEDLFKL